PGLKVPHMGWNRIRHEDQHPLLAGVPNGSYAYFVHSYYCAPANPQDILATTDYGVEFAAIVGRGRLYGIQFHPEKSQRIGLAILRNFAQMETG
ncbi:MAG: imidazole glycerol phosphate synthase subunit HisH, partial [Anaerolineales bacterium]|nr:imidazole glycerol phosphate synthase subunit HisH [Anaerolineales bacterium]